MRGIYIAAAAVLSRLAFATPVDLDARADFESRFGVEARSDLESRLDFEKRAACAGNTATTRSTWCSYNTSTNYYTTWPNTGVTRDFYFTLVNTTSAPDGVPRVVLSVNGTVPGPTIQANWGDKIRVHVTNALTANGTSIHFHGVRQLNSNSDDGVVSITQCPTAPGNTIIYEWQATQYGSSWYHSHYALQAWEGVFGGIVIHGPATANYDNDLGSLFLNDWNHATFSSLFTYSETVGPPKLDTGLINGTNTWNGAGAKFQTTFQPNQKYLLRLVNGAIDTHWDFSIDNHTLLVIASDFVPIVPYTATNISIGIGQRYDVIVTADQAAVASNFWLRAVPDNYCSLNNNPNNITGIVHYGSSTGTPTTQPYYIPPKNCSGEPAASIVPYLALSPPSTVDLQQDDTVTVGPNAAKLFKWFMNGTTFVSPWNNPTSLQVINGDSTYNQSELVTSLPTPGEWMHLIVETTIGAPHPIHLHGHDFYQLGSGLGSYANAAPIKVRSNPPRRDVAMLPANGWLVIAFRADNPGIWLTHCHIGWHTEGGLALQFVEQQSKIPALYNNATLNAGCAAWNTYTSAVHLTQDDSGI